jgi:GNAT superfamily N-acetyltransferase
LPRAESGKRADDFTKVAACLARHCAPRVARLGELVHPLENPALVGSEGDRLLGVLTYVVDGEQCGILTLHAQEKWRGTGPALVAELERVAREHGCTRLRLVTTNDNVGALRFYQRSGFRLAELHPGAVDDSRARLEREIPLLGEHGIPLARRASPHQGPVRPESAA